MLAIERERLVKRSAPDIQRLTRNGKHQIEVHIVEAGDAEDLKGAKHHVAAVHAAKSIEQSFVQRLDPHGNAVHAKFAQQPRFLDRDGGGVAFDGPFGCAQKIQPFHCREDLSPLSEVQQGWRASAEKHGFRTAIERNQFELTNQTIDVSIDRFAT